jgi:hypothetical protein
MDRETLMMIATIVAIAGVIFLFREMNKAKQDVENLKNFSAHVVQRLSAPRTRTRTRTSCRKEGRRKGRGINISTYYNLRMRNEKIQSYSDTGQLC